MSTVHTFRDPRVVALLDEAHAKYKKANELLEQGRAAEDAAREIVKKNGHPPGQVNHEIPPQERRRRAMACPWGAWGTPRPEIVEGTFE